MKKTIFILILIFVIIEVKAQGLLQYKPLPQVQDNSMEQLNDFNNQRAARDAAIRDAVNEENITKLNNVIEIYNSYKKYPDIINDGWHNAFSTNKKDFCNEVKVLVENNKVVQFSYGSNQNQIKTTSSLSIKNGIGVVNYKDNYSIDHLCYIVFLEDIDEFQK